MQDIWRKLQSASAVRYTLIFENLSVIRPTAGAGEYTVKWFGDSCADLRY
jgi:hypothetical protein